MGAMKALLMDGEVTLDLSIRNVRTGYIDSVLVIADVLRADGQWDWAMQRVLDTDIAALKDASDDDLLDIADDVMLNWEAEASKYGWDTATEDGIFWVTRRMHSPFGRGLPEPVLVERSPEKLPSHTRTRIRYVLVVGRLGPLWR